MLDPITVIIAAVFVFVILYLIHNQVLKKKLSSLNTEKTELTTRNDLLIQESSDQKSEINKLRELDRQQSSEITKLQTINQNLENKFTEQKEEIAELQSKFTETFKNLANEILEEKTQKFTEQNKSHLDQILNPLRDKIKDFEQKVNDTNEKNRMTNASLIQQIKDLKDLNHKISDDAKNLTKALKGEVKVQGNWGEVILERILEESGLKKGEEFTVQESFSEGSSRLQPDVIIYLPEEKHLIIDSKVSLINYEKMINAESEQHRETYKKALNNSVKSHIDRLQKKHYENIKRLNSPDFVFLFLPIEGAFASVLQQDTEIYQYGLKKHIVIVSPSTLLATLRTIAFIWRQENQTKNALEIAQKSGDLLDKFIGFLEDMKKIDVNISRTRSAYDDAVKKLSEGKGNILNRVKILEEMGAKAKKEMPTKFKKLQMED